MTAVAAAKRVARAGRHDERIRSVHAGLWSAGAREAIGDLRRMLLICTARRRDTDSDDTDLTDVRGLLIDERGEGRPKTSGYSFLKRSGSSRSSSRSNSQRSTSSSKKASTRLHKRVRFVASPCSSPSMLRTGSAFEATGKSTVLFEAACGMAGRPDASAPMRRPTAREAPGRAADSGAAEDVSDADLSFSRRTGAVMGATWSDGVDGLRRHVWGLLGEHPREHSPPSPPSGSTSSSTPSRQPSRTVLHASRRPLVV